MEDRILAAQILVSCIPIVGIVMGGLIIIFYLHWSFKTKVAQIERGQYSPFRFDLSQFSVFTGLLLLGIGLVLSIVLIIVYGLQPAILGGLIPLAMGFALVVYFLINRGRA